MKINIYSPTSISTNVSEEVVKVLTVCYGSQGIQGVPGPIGLPGPAGPTGPAGVGVPVGGLEGQVLAKVSATDYDTTWSDVASDNSLWEADGLTTIKPKDGKLVDASYVDNLPEQVQSDWSQIVVTDASYIVNKPVNLSDFNDDLVYENPLSFSDGLTRVGDLVSVNAGEVDHDSLLNTHNLTTDIDHNTITNTHNLTTDIDHNSLTNSHNLTTDIDHNTITNTHNLTTDIDHDSLTNYEADEHVDWAVTQLTNIHPDNYTDTDEKVKYDDEDPTAGYIADKVIAGDGINVIEGTGADENKLVIENTDKGSDVSVPSDVGDLTDDSDLLGDKNVQSDWSQANTEADDFIKNKPTLSEGDMTKIVYDPANGEKQVAFSDDARLSDDRTPTEHDNEKHSENYIVDIESESIADLSDVDDTGKDTGKILKYNAISENWEIGDDENTTYTSSSFDIKDLTDSTNLRTTWSGKQDALGYTAENSANKQTSFQETPTDTAYPSEKLVKDSLDATLKYEGVWAEETNYKANTMVSYAPELTLNLYYAPEFIPGGEVLKGLVVDTKGFGEENTIYNHIEWANARLYLALSDVADNQIKVYQENTSANTWAGLASGDYLPGDESDNARVMFYGGRVSVLYEEKNSGDDTKLSLVEAGMGWSYKSNSEAFVTGEEPNYATNGSEMFVTFYDSTGLAVMHHDGMNWAGYETITAAPGNNSLEFEGMGDCILAYSDSGNVNVKKYDGSLETWDFLESSEEFLSTDYEVVKLYRAGTDDYYLLVTNDGQAEVYQYVYNELELEYNWEKVSDTLSTSLIDTRGVITTVEEPIGLVCYICGQVGSKFKVFRWSSEGTTWEEVKELTTLSQLKISSNPDGISDLDEFQLTFRDGDEDLKNTTVRYQTGVISPEDSPWIQMTGK